MMELQELFEEVLSKYEHFKSMRIAERSIDEEGDMKELVKEIQEYQEKMMELLKNVGK